MPNFLSRWFSGFIAPPKMTEVSMKLADYVQALVAHAMMEEGLEEHLVQIAEGRKSIDSLSGTGLDLNPERIFFICCFAASSCMHLEVDESDQVYAVLVWVLREGLCVPQEQARNIANQSMSSFAHLMDRQLSEDEPDDSDLIDPRLLHAFASGVAASMSFAKEFGSDKIEPTEFIITTFVELGPENSEK